MARKHSRISRPALLPTAEDLKRIRGIGPALAGRLHHAGIHTYHQLASLSPTELSAHVPGLSAKQVTRQDWIGQARKLAIKKTSAKSHKKEMAPLSIHQHYENFTIEFLLDEKNVMRRTRVVHVQSGDADTWAGWEAESLIDFLARHTKIYIPEEKSLTQKTEALRQGALLNTAGASGSTILPISKPVGSPSVNANLSQPITQFNKTVLPSLVAANLAGILRLRDLKVISIEAGIPIFSLPQGQQYLLQLTLDLAKVVAPDNAPLIFRATIIFKQLGGSLQSMREISNTLTSSDSATLEIQGVDLPPGIYHVDAYVRLTSNEKTPGLTAFLKGDLLQVY
jgi:hypothetical protein